MMSQADSLPIISLQSHGTVEQLAKALHDSCTEEGFIYISDHGIPQLVVDEAFDISARYFAGPHEGDSHDFANNVGYVALLDSTKPGADVKECYHLADPAWKDPVLVDRRLPDILEKSREALDDLISQINGVAERILQGLAVGLNLTLDHFARQHCGQHNRLRLLHYPPVEVDHLDLDPGKPDIRAGSHTDYGSITLLFQHTTSGLQVKRRDDWVDVPPKAGCIVVNIGDAMEFWSGGVYKSYLQTHQPAMAFFVQPDTDSRLEPVSGAFDETILDEIIMRKGLPEGTRKVNGGEYLRLRLSATYATKSESYI